MLLWTILLFVFASTSIAFTNGSNVHSFQIYEICKSQNNRTGNITTVYGSCPLCYSSSLCVEGRTGRLCGTCSPGYGVPINQLNKCVHCDQHPLPGSVIFILIQLVPVTVVVLMIVIFNIQLTSGFVSGLVFYCQMLSVVYPGLNLNIMVMRYIYASYSLKDNCGYVDHYYITLPSNIFNLNFVAFLVNYPLCITSNMTPLQAISFWYVIPTFPLALLLLVYIWITMYDKGFRCVVTVTQTAHRLLARFWRITNTERSLIHSLFTIYLLCFTQLAATSLQLLHHVVWSVGRKWNESDTVFFYDGTVEYFGWPHCIAGISAIIVLVFIVILPMLYIQLYPFKIFHIILEKLHLRYEMLILVGDMFTGPYKNGSNDDSYDYRFFAGLFLIVRIIILCLHFTPGANGFILFSQLTIFAILAGLITIFRPYRKNIHSAYNVGFLLYLVCLCGFSLIHGSTKSGDKIIFSFVFPFGLWLLIYGNVPRWVFKKLESCYKYFKVNRQRQQSNSPLSEGHQDTQPLLGDDDDNWVADRMENPDNYDERHARHAPYDLQVSQPQKKAVHVTYGSTDTALTTHNQYEAQISERDTSCSHVSTSRDSEGLSLHPVPETERDASCSHVLTSRDTESLSLHPTSQSDRDASCSHVSTSRDTESLSLHSTSQSDRDASCSHVSTSRDTEGLSLSLHLAATCKTSYGSTNESSL